MNKKLYVVTAKSVFWSYSPQHVMTAISNIDKNDMWLIDPSDIKEVENDTDIPDNYGFDLCPVDSDRSLSDDIWAGKSLGGILNDMQREKMPAKGTVEYQLVSMERQIQSLNNCVSALMKKLENV